MNNYPRNTETLTFKPQILTFVARLCKEPFCNFSALT